MRLNQETNRWAVSTALLLSLMGFACNCGVDSDSDARAGDAAHSSPGADDGAVVRAPRFDELWEAIDDGVVDPTGFGDDNDRDNDLFDDEILARARFELTSIALTGSVHDLAGDPIATASVRVGDQEVTTDAGGVFRLAELPRRNSAVAITAAGYKGVIAHAHLQRPLEEDRTALGPIALSPDNPDVVRFLFGGDTAFGRRFVDPEEQAGPLEVPDTNPQALIDASDPEPGTRQAMRHVRPWFRGADFGAVNLETPVTRTPIEYHDAKQYTFYTLPESLGVFPWLGVSYVSLGNNHLYDYLEDGVLDTLAALGEHGISNSGAGLDPEASFLAHREELGGSVYSLLSMTSVSGSQNPPLYVATDDPIKGGAADLRDDERVVAAISGEHELGNVVIAQLHTGKEYTYWPSDYARDRMSLAVTSGADLVIGHHPHIAQGFAYEDGTLIVEGLGNLCFDQARLDTMLSLLAEVDLRGSDVVAARGIPIYLEDYTPRPTTGAAAELLIRRIGEVSENATVVLEAGAGRVLPSAQPVATFTRRQTLSLELDPAGAIVDLRAHRRPGESLLDAHMAVDAGTIQAGEDILVHGDFEDWDVDEEQFELARWDVTGGSSFPCLSETHGGTVALCSVRSASNGSNSVVAFRNRVRVLGEELGEPNKDLSLVGYARGQNAGEMRLEVAYYASVGSREFGREVAWQHHGGDFDWSFFTADLNMPPDVEGTNPLTDSAHALRLFFFHEPPDDGDGIARLDDVAVVSWRAPVAAEDGVALTVPNPVDFVRVRGLTGEHDLLLTWRSASVVAEGSR